MRIQKNMIVLGSRGVQLQDKCGPLEVQCLHHKDVALGSDLEMAPKAVLHLLVQLEARKM